jgi:hypothetical protein
VALRAGCGVERLMAEEVACALVAAGAGAVPLGWESGAWVVVTEAGLPEPPEGLDASLLAVTAPPTMMTTAAAESTPARVRVSHGSSLGSGSGTASGPGLPLSSRPRSPRPEPSRAG